MTEEEAKTKWCPHTRMYPGGYNFSDGPNTPNQRYGTCVGSGCMAWRWNYIAYISPTTGEQSIGAEIVHGHCGLAGRP